MSNYENKIKELCDSFGDWWKKGFDTPTMSNDLYPYEKLFSPIRVNNITIKNRLVMAPMGNISMCDETGRPNMKMLKYFEERAKGGVGLITSGLIPVSYGIDKSLIELGQLTYFPRIDRSRSVFAGWRDLSAMCHAHGSHFFIQLTPGLGRVGNPQCVLTQMKFPRSASFNPNWYMPNVPCMRLSDSSLKKIIKKLGQGAADAKVANIDGVYLHGHEGYLLEQITNSAFNHRILGRYANPETFGIDAVKEIRRRVGPNFPIMYRIDLSLALNATYKGRMKTTNPLKKFRNERTADQTLEYMKNLVAAGVDMFDVDLGCYDNWWLPHPPSSMPSGCYLDIAQIAKNYFEENNIKSNKGLDIPVVAVGKLGYPDLAEKALRDNKCDMIMLGRPLLADPYWPQKAYEGKTLDILPCIGCQEGCINEFVEGGHPQCAVNPRTAFEEEYSLEIPKADKAKKVAVIGAGPAGVVAAKTLVERGHSVVLYEKTAIGGNLNAGSAAVIKYECKNYVEYLKRVVGKLVESGKLEYINKAADTDTLIEGKFDVIVTCSGSKQMKPPVEGINQDNVLFAIDVLKNPDLVKGAKDIVIIGGGVVGAETAYFVKYELGINCKVVEMDKYIMNHACTANRGHLIHYLEEGGVELLNATKLVKVEDKKVYVSQNIHKNVPNPYITWTPILPDNVENPLAPKMGNVLREKVLDADYVLVAAGVRSCNELYFECVKDRIAPEIYNLGDSLKNARVFEAVKAAYRKCRNI